MSAVITFLHSKWNNKCIGHIDRAGTTVAATPTRESAMSRSGTARGLFASLIAILLAQPAASAQDEKLGVVNFPISCSAGAQAQFNRAVAMLHSFFFPET